MCTGGAVNGPRGAARGRKGMWTWDGAGVHGGARERARGKRGAGGSWWRLGKRERRECAAEARWRCGEHERRGWVRRVVVELERRRLRDRASSRGAPGQSGGVGVLPRASRGAAWYWGGGRSPTLHGSAA